MPSVGRIMTHRDRVTLETPHRRFFVKALCRAMTRAIDSTLGMETSATASATATVAGAIFLAASSADPEPSASCNLECRDVMSRHFFVLPHSRNRLANHASYCSFNLRNRRDLRRVFDTLAKLMPHPHCSPSRLFTVLLFTTYLL